MALILALVCNSFLTFCLLVIYTFVVGIHKDTTSEAVQLYKTNAALSKFIFELKEELFKVKREDTGNA